MKPSSSRRSLSKHSTSGNTQGRRGSKSIGRSQPLIQSPCGFHDEHECDHNHNNHKKADIWTILATMGEGISSGASNFYWGISLADIISSLCISEETPSALSWGMGCSMAAFAIGSMYAHTKLNIFHQHAHGHAHGPATGTLLPKEDVIEIAQKPSDSHNLSKALSIGQKVALCADFISHTGDVCGPITAGVVAITKIAVGTTLPPWGNALAQVAAISIGAATATANVRTCKHAIEAQN